MSTQTRGFPSGEMRASDADRDLALAELSEHFQTGRLTQEEFDDRSGRALRARTGRELSELFGDLPPSHAGLPQSYADVPWSQAGAVRSPAWGVSRRRPRGRVAIWCAIACVIVVDALFSSGAGHHVSFGLLVPVLVVLFVIRRVRAR
jgi:hypothetical protein